MDEFVDEVAARIGALPFGESGPVVEARILVDPSSPSPGFLATLRVGAEETRAFRSGDCADLANTMAAAIAIRLQPDSGITAGRTPAAVDGTVRVRLETAPQQELVLHRITGRQTGYVYGGNGAAYGFGMTFEPVCAAPCEERLPTGRYEFAISSGTAAPVALPEATRLHADAAFRLGYTSRETERVVGFLTMTGGPVVGVLSLVPALAIDEISITGNDPAAGWVIFGLGMGVVVVGIVAGLILAIQGDEVSLEPIRFCDARRGALPRITGVPHPLR